MAPDRSFLAEYAGVLWVGAGYCVMGSLVRPLFLVLLVMSVKALADPLAQAYQSQLGSQKEAQASQKQVEKLDDKTRSLLTRYQSLLAEIEASERRNQMLQQQVKGQQEKLAEEQAAILKMEQLKEQIQPLNQQMFASLEQVVATDLPFLTQERQQRLRQLEHQLTDPDLTVAARYQRLLEALLIEDEYGRQLETWSAPLATAHETREVNFLLLGRLALYYQTPDRSESGYWDPATHSWKTLPTSMAADLNAAMHIARHQRAPQWLSLPVPVSVVRSNQPIANSSDQDVAPLAVVPAAKEVESE